jgi:hypothetical protein
VTEECRIPALWGREEASSLIWRGGGQMFYKLMEGDYYGTNNPDSNSNNNATDLLRNPVGADRELGRGFDKLRDISVHCEDVY